MADRNRGGSCLACHVMGQAGNADLPGNVGPDLSEIGNAGREDEWLFNYIYDARVYNPETVMPPWGSHGVFNDQEISDMVAFLKTLKTPAVFKTALDDPDKRPAPVEKRDNLDAIENPGMWAVDKAQELWKQKSSIGFSCNTCHSDPKDDVQDLGGVDAEMGAAAQQGAGRRGVRHPPCQGHDRRRLADGDRREPRDVGLSALSSPTARRSRSTPPARKRKRRSSAARRCASRKVGELNFACTDCHGKAANHWIRGQWLGEPKGQYDHFPTWRTSLLAIWDIRQRFQWCQVNIRADELPPDAKEYGDLELYLASQNEG